MPDIASPSNQHIKWLARLRERRHRDAERLFLVEGERLYTRAVAAGLEPEITFVASGSGVTTVGEVLTVEPTALDRASYRQRSQGVIGVFPYLDTTLAGIDTGDDTLVLVAEGLEKPGNLGAMLRSVAAAGADALVLVETRVDPHNPNVVRASTGALFTVPVATTDWDQLGPWLSTAGLRVLGATPDGSAAPWEVDLTGGIALLVGAEDRGLSPLAQAACHGTVAIPQLTEGVDSLNVSVSAGILLFEARRQRS